MAIHDPKLGCKIQPSDVDKSIDEILAEVKKMVPPLRRKAVVEHPVTGERRARRPRVAGAGPGS